MAYSWYFPLTQRIVSYLCLRVDTLSVKLAASIFLISEVNLGLKNVPFTGKPHN